jgi:signal transduction histidine kinase/CheY-like chemotaxis protein
MMNLFQSSAIARQAAEIAASRDLTRRITDIPSGKLGEIAVSINAILAEAESRDRELRAKVDELVDARDDAQTANQLLRRLKNGLKARSIERDTALRRAEAATEAKSQFLANMSHEIRTPLHGILGIADVLSKTPLEARQLSLVGTMIRSGRGLLGIINAVLDYSKIESGQFDLNPRPFSLRVCVDDLVHELSSRFEKKGLELVTRVEETLPDLVIGDGGRLKQVLTNLLENGLKYTDDGYVLLDIAGTPAGNTADLLISVQDTGVGIPKDKLRSVFEKFNQVDNSSTRRHEGVGLGLAICRMLVEKMDGRIEVSSELGHGSTFTVSMSLPVHEAGPAALPSSGRPHRAVEISHPSQSSADANIVAIKGGRFERARVLLVEDNIVNQEVAKEYLSELGCAVSVAANGREAIAAFGSERFDLIFMDCLMPEMDGFQATRQIRETEQRNNMAPTPIVALTANAYDSDRNNCLAAGMSDFLGKPFNFQQLEAMLRKWFPRDDQQPQARVG